MAAITLLEVPSALTADGARPPKLAPPATCADLHYDATAQHIVVALLKDKYGDAYDAFDVNYPSLLNLVSQKRHTYDPDSGS